MNTPIDTTFARRGTWSHGDGEGDEAPGDPQPTPANGADAKECSPPIDLNGTLFGPQPGDGLDIGIHDLRQGQVDDCSLFATLGGLTRTDAGRALIRAAIVPNKDSSGAVTSFTVTLHEAHRNWFAFKTTFTDHPVTVPAGEIHGCHAVARELAGPGSGFELWPLVIESAYLQYRGGAERARQPPVDVMELLTGKPATNHSVTWGWSLYGADEIERDVAAGKVVVVSTQRGLPNGTDQALPSGTGDLISDHAYLVTKTERRDGSLFVTLHNPWDAEVGPIEYSVLQRSLNTIDVCDP